MKPESIGVGIVGPPRSGTSSAAIYLERAGFYLGDADDIGAVDQFNPDGYREHAEINALNRETGYMFLLPGETHTPLPQSWEQHPLSDRIIARTQATFGSIFGEARFWAFKDPRTTLLLPIYRRALTGVNMGYLAMVRRPAPCARSIAKRDGSSLDVALGVWIEYTLCALKYLEGCPCRFVEESEWLENPRLAVGDLMGFMGVSPSELSLEDAAIAVRPELRSKGGEDPASLEFADKCYLVAAEAARVPRSYLEGGLKDSIDELWNEWQAWRELRNARRDRIVLKLISDRDEVNLFEGAAGPPWSLASARFQGKEVSLVVEPLGTSIFIRSAILKSSLSLESPLVFGRSGGASWGWSPEGVCRLCSWSEQGVPILLPKFGTYSIAMKVQAYPTISSAIAEVLSSRARS